ncbi:hypothetical protein [Halohasta salina]|uniref:hypothetical protein n=1 Tax=Halohasta salina TaxID=2961621 RepID=UPI0020A59941|nr:hypothetical protein [Halohasta salina]
MPVEFAPELALQAFGGSFGDVASVLGEPSIWVGAFAGGAFGAAIGALPAFVLTGLLVVAGAAANIVGVAPEGSVDLVGIGFGHVFGPHISFAGGAAAAAYAAKQGYMESGFDYHNAKDIGFALGNKPDVLAVGGLFGLLGIAIEQLSRNLLITVDPIPVSIVISAFVHRAVFGYALIGKPQGSGLLDMGPFERGETVGAGAGGASGGENGGEPEAEWLATEPWLPQQYKWAEVSAIGLIAGLASGYLAFRTGSPFLGFGISAASLLFLNLGVENFPVTHHITLAGSTVFLAVTASGEAALAGLSVTAGLLIAGGLGLVAALLGELTQRIFYAHGRTHIDPPAMAIVVWSFGIGLLYVAGLIPTGVWIPGTV